MGVHWEGVLWEGVLWEGDAPAEPRQNRDILKTYAQIAANELPPFVGAMLHAPREHATFAPKLTSVTFSNPTAFCRIFAELNRGLLRFVSDRELSIVWLRSIPLRNGCRRYHRPPAHIPPPSKSRSEFLVREKS